MPTIAINPIDAFDATQEKSIEFTYSGNQPIANSLVIFDNENNSIVYNERKDVHKLSHTLPIEVLKNGKEYNVQITAYYLENNVEMQVTSEKISFLCRTNPVWKFTNLAENQIIKNSAFSLEIEYFQKEGELLNEFKVELYDVGKHLQWNSDVKQPPNSAPGEPVLLNVELGVLANDTYYYVIATGKTVNQMDVTTGFIPFKVEYKTTGLYSVLSLKNKEREASVEISSNIVHIFGKPIPDPPTYIDEKMIDLRETGSSVTFDEGFSLDGDFLLELIMFEFIQNNPIVRLTDGYNHIILTCRKDFLYDENDERFAYSFVELSAGLSPNYVIFSNQIMEDIGEIDVIYLRLRRVRGLYDLRIEKG